jgi:hypothetical protein
LLIFAFIQLWMRFQNRNCHRYIELNGDTFDNRLTEFEVGMDYNVYQKPNWIFYPAHLWLLFCFSKGANYPYHLSHSALIPLAVYSLCQGHGWCEVSARLSLAQNLKLEDCHQSSHPGFTSAKALLWRHHLCC